jgi:hypothetical protein
MAFKIAKCLTKVKNKKKGLERKTVKSLTDSYQTCDIAINIMGFV